MNSTIFLIYRRIEITQEFLDDMQLSTKSAKTKIYLISDLKNLSECS